MKKNLALITIVSAAIVRRELSEELYKYYEGALVKYK